MNKTYTFFNPLMQLYPCGSEMPSIDWEVRCLYDSTLVSKGIDRKKEDLKMNKTYEMWASDHFIKNLPLNKAIGFSDSKNDFFKNKVTITFHEDPKITISRSEFEEKWKESRHLNHGEFLDKLFNQKEGE